MSEIVKICKIHGNLTIDQTRKDGDKFRCKACRKKSNNNSYYIHREKRVATSQAWKEKNREHYRDWARNDRAKNPEKYRIQERARREKIGSKLVLNEILRMHGLTKEQYENLVKKHNNLCAICFKSETRKSRVFDKPARLCVDHCHSCRDKGLPNVRGLLCHACNQAIGHAKENIEILEKAIEYLKKHSCN